MNNKKAKQLRRAARYITKNNERKSMLSVPMSDYILTTRQVHGSVVTGVDARGNLIRGVVTVDHTDAALTPYTPRSVYKFLKRSGSFDSAALRAVPSLRTLSMENL